MRYRRRIAVVLPIVALLAVLAAGCGSRGSSGTENSTHEGVSSSERNNTTEPSSNGALGNFGKRPSAAVSHFGSEAEQVERESASAVLEDDLRARAAGEWARQCASLSKEQVEEIKELSPQPKGKESCVVALRILASPLAQTKPFRANTMAGSVYAFRVGGTRGFALYHGKNGIVYAMVMRREGGKWKVDDLTPTELPEL